MGSAANLAVRHRKRTYFLHARSGGYTSDVLGLLASTIAAAGVDTLLERLDWEGLPPIVGEDGEVEVDRRGMGNTYLAATQARGQEPVGLRAALSAGPGNPHFADAGIIPMLAPSIDWAAGRCNGIDRADFILDLDRGVLAVSSRGGKTGEYDQGVFEPVWEIALADLQGLDPSALLEAFAGAKNQLGYDQARSPRAQRQATIATLLEQVRTGQVPRPPGRASNPYREDWHPREAAAEPTVHGLAGTKSQAWQAHALGRFLRDMGQGMPALARDDAVLEHEDARGNVLVVVDLRANPDSCANGLVQAVMESMALASEAVYDRISPHHAVAVARWASITHAGPRAADDGRAWDEDLVPEGARAVDQGVDLQRRAEQALAAGDTQVAGGLLERAIVDLDGTAWELLASGPSTPQPDALRMRELAGRVADMAEHFERAAAGSTGARFDRLSAGQRAALLAAMEPLDRWRFSQWAGSLEAGKPGRDTMGPVSSCRRTTP